MKYPFIVVLTLALSAPVALARTPIDGIAAVINDQIILRSELEQATTQTRTRARLSGQSVPQGQTLQRQVLDELIVRELQLQRASKLGIRIDESTVDRAMQSIASRNGLSLSDFRQQISRQGLDYRQFRDDIRQDLLIDQLREREVFRGVVVSDQEIEKELEGYYKGAQARSRYWLEHVVVRVPEGASDSAVQKARQLASRLSRRLANGVELSKVTGTDSASGLQAQGQPLGWRTVAQIPDLFTRALRTLGKGDASAPLRSEAGWHVIRARDIEGPATTPPQQVRDQIRAKIREVKASGEFTDWLTRLRESAYIELKQGQS